MIYPHVRMALRRTLNSSVSFTTSSPIVSFNRQAATLTLHHFAPKTKSRRTPRSNVAPPEVPPPRRVAVIGGGLAGLATAYHLLHSTARYARKRSFAHTDLHLTIFDPNDPAEGGASAAAAGLLHPFAPRVKTKIWQSVKAIDAALHLVNEAQSCSPTPLIAFPGLLRLALREQQLADYRIAANRFPKEVQFLEPHEVASRFPHVNHHVPAVFLNKAAVVNTPEYLRALWSLCEQSGRIEWRKQSVSDVRQILGETASSFDTVVVCAGAAIPCIEGVGHVPLQLCRGQNLILQPREQTCAQGNVHKQPVISGKYIVPDLFSDKKYSRIVAGATFEHQRDEQHPDRFMQDLCKKDTARAVSELREPLQAISPHVFEDYNILGTTSGTRALPPRSANGSVPIVCKMLGTDTRSSCWLFTGLGSRGLLHHAFLGRMLAHAIVAGNERLIPFEARRLELELPTIESDRDVAVCNG
ncbi:FAD dependent oxidoreductase [Gracilaria domingensis]|nr:FAD dependent oxidoreductase [Gracilaria domingensis]